MTGFWIFVAVLGAILAVTLITFITIALKKRSAAVTPQGGQPAAGTTGGAAQQKKPGWFLPFAKKVATVIFFVWFSWFLVIDVLQRAEQYKHTGPVRVTDPSAIVKPVVPSQFFNGQTHYLREIMQFCYFDEELNLSREEGWDCVDMIKLESEFQMYNLDGTVKLGDQNKDDKGAFMINVKWSAKEIAKAGCNIESFECQKKVFRLIFLEKRSFERWTAYPRVKNLKVRSYPVSAPAGAWGEIFNPPVGDSCFVKPNRNLEMLGDDGTPVPISPEYVPFISTDTLQFRSTDETPGEVVMMCRSYPA